MRYDPFTLRLVLAAAALTLAACATNENQNQAQRPNGKPGGPGMRPDGTRPGPNGNKPKPPPPKPNMSPDEVMSRADANKDGALSLQEDIDFALKEAETRFSRMDRDHDGRLTSQELAEAEKRRQSMSPENKPEAGGNGDRQPPSPQSLMTRADANHDGVVDRSENRALAKDQASKRFRFGDKNHDGRLERSEMQVKPQPPSPAQ